MRLPVYALGLFVVLSPPAQAQNTELNTLLNEDGAPIVLYSSPQSTIFSQQQPSALLQPSPGGQATLFGLTVEGDEVVVGNGADVTGQQLTITGRRTIVQRGQVQEWLRVDGGDGTGGWLLAPANSANQ